jgi:hypothetical protein
MIFAPDHGLVLLLPWKCASQTLGARLAAVDRSPYSKFYAANPHLRRVTHQHIVLPDFVGLPESRLGLDLAVFVRNPYDRVYSGFMEIQRQIRLAPHLEYPAMWIRELVLEAMAINHARVERAGRDVNLWFQHLPEHEILDVGRNASLPLHPAHFWTHLAGTAHVSLLGRVEAFEADFVRLCLRYGITTPPRVDANRTSSVADAPENTRYTHANQLQPATIEKINALFAADFSLFGYAPLRP